MFGKASDGCFFSMWQALHAQVFQDDPHAEWNREWREREREINRMVIRALKSSIGVHFGSDNSFSAIVIPMQAWEELMQIPKT